MSEDRWRDQAACADHPAELWYPAKNDGGDNHGSQAKAICAQCPVREQCLDWAISTGEKWGIQAGAGEKRKRQLRRQWLQGPDAWKKAKARHFTNLDRTNPARIDCNGPGANHGLPATYANGCRCTPCTIAASFRGAQSAATHGGRKNGRRNRRRVA